MFKNKVTFTPFPPCRDEKGNVVVLPIDQFNSQEFNRGNNGLPANDITLLMRAQSQAEYDMLAARLQEVRKTEPSNDGKSDSDIIKAIWPRSAQTPSELNKFMDYYNKVNPSSVNNIDSVESLKAESHEEISDTSVS